MSRSPGFPILFSKRHLTQKMAAQSKIPASPISISSQSASPRTINISSDPPAAPAPAPAPARRGRAAYQTPFVPAYRPMEASRAISRASSVISARTSIPDVDFAMEEIATLRDKCAELEAENHELQGRIDVWKCAVLPLLHECH